MIRIDNLTKIYPQNHVGILQLSLIIKTGQVFGLLGPNGAGKSTLIKILKGVFKPTSGTFAINNISYDPKKDNRDLKRQTGYLPEENLLLPFLSVREYLKVIGILYEVETKEIRRRVTQLLKLFDLFEYQNQEINALSEGMKQKVLWIATLIPNTPVILLDDPLRALDVHSFELIVSLIRRLKELSKTILLATHYISLIEKTCDNVAFIKAGKIVETCSIENGDNTIDLYNRYLKLFPNPTNLDDFKRVDL